MPPLLRHPTEAPSTPPPPTPTTEQKPLLSSGQIGDLEVSAGLSHRPSGRFIANVSMGSPDGVRTRNDIARCSSPTRRHARRRAAQPTWRPCIWTAATHYPGPPRQGVQRPTQTAHRRRQLCAKSTQHRAPAAPRPQIPQRVALGSSEQPPQLVAVELRAATPRNTDPHQPPHRLSPTRPRDPPLPAHTHKLIGHPAPNRWSPTMTAYPRIRSKAPRRGLQHNQQRLQRRTSCHGTSGFRTDVQPSRALGTQGQCADPERP